MKCLYDKIIVFLERLIMIFFKINNKDLCFIHIPKTAGTSFQNTILKNKLDNKKFNLSFANYMSKYSCKTGGHVPFYFINSFFLTKMKMTKKISFLTIVRNPWDRIASLFEQEMLRDGFTKFKKTALDKDIRNLFQKKYHVITKNFLSSVGLMNIKKMKQLFKYWLFYLGFNRKVIPNLNPNFNVIPQAWWYKDSLSEDIIKKIYLFEDLSSLELILGFKLLHNNRKANLNYSDFYDQETIDYVYNLDKETIDKFGYDFKLK